jgi:hypothetical protein
MDQAYRFQHVPGTFSAQSDKGFHTLAQPYAGAVSTHPFDSHAKWAYNASTTIYLCA